MNKKFGFNKPFAVCYGNYDISPNYRDRKELKKLIYAGVLGKEGSDVDLAIDVMQYLPDNYDLKIAGYGRHDEVIYINNKISDKRNIEFVGFLSGEEYEDFLSKGDVGLCTRVLPNELSDYTFPSKVLVYLSHGLVPLCPSIDCLKKSSVSKTIIFYEESAPESIAKALMQEVKDSSTVRIIKTLDNNFIYSLSAIIECLKSEN